MKVTHSQRKGRNMKGWMKKTDDRESVDDSELNDLTLTPLEIFKKKKADLLYSPSFDCMSELSEVS